MQTTILPAWMIRAGWKLDSQGKPIRPQQIRAAADLTGKGH